MEAKPLTLAIPSDIDLFDKSGQWNAGYGSDAVTLNVTRWTNNEVIIKGFRGEYGKNGWVFNPGDAVQVELASPSQPASGNFPATLDLTIPDGSFIGDKGTFTTINTPGAVPDFPEIIAMNNSGEVAGSYYDDNGGAHAFIDDKGTFTTIDAPGASFHLCLRHQRPWRGSRILR